MLKDLFEEIRSFMRGSTMDAILPGLIFVVANRPFGLTVALILAVVVALALFIYRKNANQAWYYSIFGVVGVVIASGFAFAAGNASSFFLPEILSSGGLLLACLVSLAIKKPLAAWLSHLTRGWTRSWFWRKDILPAYMEVTVFWAVFIGLRIYVLINLYFDTEVETLFLVNTIMGMPATLVVLSITYIYGIWRLKRLGGPGVDEFDQGIDGPWRGQLKGF